MNKKNIILIIFLVVVIVGLIFWQFFKQNLFNSQTAKDNNFTNSQSQKVAENLVEVFYLPHPPVDPIRKKIENILQKFPNYTLKEYNFEEDSNKQKIASYNLIGHIPVAIFIGGVKAFTIDGQKITFQNFPKGDTFVPTLEGSWNYNDLEKVLTDPNKYKND